MNADVNEERAEKIARLVFRFVREMLLRDWQRLEAGGVALDELLVPPVHVSFETMDDETIARESAALIHRSLLQALGG